MKSEHIAFLAQGFSRKTIEKWYKAGISFDHLPTTLDTKSREILNTLPSLHEGQNYCTFIDADWPHFLDVYTKPQASVLYYQGDFSLLNRNEIVRVGIVGARSITTYAHTVLKKLAIPSINHMGVAVVSGLAYGVDAATHIYTLSTQAKAVGVIAGGLDQSSFYPSENWKLKNQIIQSGGLVISEYPYGTQPKRYTFIARNRLIAAMSKLIIVVQASAKSGSLTTAEFALEMGKDVATFPVRTDDEWGKGNLHLIKMGAQCVTDISDIHAMLSIPSISPITGSSPPYMNSDNPLIQLLAQEPHTVEQLAQLLHMDIPVIQTQLSELELQSIIINRNGLWSIFF